MTGSVKIYGASKVKHWQLWRSFRDMGCNITSTWIDFVDQVQYPEALAGACISEIENCDALIIYAEEWDVLKGAYIEMGAALAFNKPVYMVGKVLKDESVFSTKAYRCRTILEAFKLINQHFNAP